MRALVRSKIALSVGGRSIGVLISSNRSVSARHASGEKRSRITDAADRAASTRKGMAPSRSRFCSTAAATSTGLAFGRSVGTASHSPSSAQMRATTRVGGLVAVAGAVDERPNQPQRRFGTFHVAGHPEQIVGGAARQRPRCTRDRDAIGRGQQCRLGDRLVRQHPGVTGAPAPLQAHGARVDIVGDAHESAGHDPPPLAGARQEQPQRERARLQLAVAPHRRRRQR